MRVFFGDFPGNWAPRIPAWTLALVVALGGCGSSDVVDLQFGGLTVDTITSGANLDPNAYNLQVTGSSLNVEQTIGLNDRVVFSVAPGSYSVRLGDVAANCVVDINPANVTITAGGAASVIFRVVCAGN